MAQLFDHNPQIGSLCDKLHSKVYFQDRCPDLAVAELLWSGDRPEDIPDPVLDGHVAVKGQLRRRAQSVYPG